MCHPKRDWRPPVLVQQLLLRAFSPFAKKINHRSRSFSHSRSAWKISSAAMYEVSISALSTMPRNSQGTKRAKITVYKSKGKKDNNSSGSFVVFKPTKTRRGKTIYTEVDAAPYYSLSNEGGETPKRTPSKTPSRSKTTVPPSLEDTFQGEASFLDDQGPQIPRITKVRLRL